jgi:hypothetical protein
MGGLAPTGVGRAHSPYFAPNPTQHIIALAWGKIPLIDLPQKKKIAELKPKGNAVFVAWRDNGTQILSVDDKSNVQIWDMAFPDSEDPVIVVAAEGTLYECRYSAVIGKKPGIKVIR